MKIRRSEKLRRSEAPDNGIQDGVYLLQQQVQVSLILLGYGKKRKEAHTKVIFDCNYIFLTRIVIRFTICLFWAQREKKHDLRDIF